jgi:hypothetical protein
VATYICSLPDTKRAGRISELISDDPAAIERFCTKWDRPGRGVFECVSPLRKGARRRALLTVAALTQLHVDIDLRKLTNSREEVLAKLQQLPLRLEIRDSGGGFHAVARLKEPVPAKTPEYTRLNKLRSQLTKILCGDPLPDHAAALLRRVGTHNSKYEGEPRLVHVLQEAEPVDSIDLEELVELLGNVRLFTPLSKPNGRDRTEVPPQATAPDEHKPPVDIEKRLNAMAFQGSGDSAIHLTQLQVSASMLRAGQGVDTAVSEVIAATRRAVADDPAAADWDWRSEQLKVERMCFDFIGKNPELAILLPDKLQAPFKDAQAAGKTPKIVYASHIGWHVRSFDDPPADGPRREASAKNEAEGDGGGNGGTAGQKQEKRARGTFMLRPFVPFDLASLPPRQWLYGKHYQRCTVSATISPGGFGKSSLDMVELVAMATGRNLLGEQPTERLRCWFHNGEDPLEELNRRLGAICLRYGIPQQELRGWFFMTSGNEVPLRVAKGYSDLKIHELLIKCIAEEIARNEIDVATLDPLVTLHSVPEQDNSKMDAVVRIFAGIADAQDCAIELAHHTRKLAPGMTDYVANDIRGASAIKDAVRAARMLNQMTETDAGAVGVPEHERTSYFRVDRVKGNNAPPAKAVWRRFVNVELPNTDEVGVVVPWDFPGQGAPSPEMTAAEQAADTIFMQLLARLTLEGRTVSDKAGTNYAPHVFSQEQEAKGAKIGKRPLADAMRRLFAAKRIRVEHRSQKGRVAYCLVAARGRAE